MPSISTTVTSLPRNVSGPYANLMPGYEHVSFLPQGVHSIVEPSSKR